jgi:hypothetical protein
MVQCRWFCLKPADFVNTVGWLVTKYLDFPGLLRKSHIDNPTISQ